MIQKELTDDEKIERYRSLNIITNKQRDEITSSIKNGIDYISKAINVLMDASLNKQYDNLKDISYIVEQMSKISSGLSKINEVYQVYERTEENEHLKNLANDKKTNISEIK